MIAESLISQLGVARTEFLEFVALFARVECALKEAGFYRTPRDVIPAGRERIAKPDWRRLTARLAPHFNASRTEALAQSCDYLLERRPQKQVIGDRGLEWRDLVFDDQSNALEKVVQAINVVRNNLLHGGKWQSGPLEEPSRSHKLLKASIIILEECVGLSAAHAPKVYRAFWNNLRATRPSAA